LSADRQILLNCSRQSGKSTTVAVLALHTALFQRSLTLLLSPSLRQSSELFRKVLEGYNGLERPLRAVNDSQTQLELANGSRIVWQDCPRITPDFIEQEKRSMGESWVRQEYGCSFEALEGLVFPDLEARCGCDVPLEGPGSPAGRPVGGLDFGFRNPFAAVW